MGDLVQRIAKAQAQKDEGQLLSLLDEARTKLGDSAGVPEVADEFQEVPAGCPKLATGEIKTSFKTYLRVIRRRAIGSVGEDPTQVEHMPRDAASVLTGCVAAYLAGCEPKDELLAFCKEVAEYLLWIQEQGEVGVFPFPARSGGKGKVFGIADRALKQAEKEGRIREVVRHGWFIEDRGLDDGGLQFDNGECGIALLDLYDLTHDKKYLASAQRAADWTIDRPCVPNWNYNSFSVSLLAEVFRRTQIEKYRAASKEKARLGVYPGQLTVGIHAGRWMDAHNARPAYHYILVQSLVRLVSILEENDPERARAVEALRLALITRNQDFPTRGIPNVGKALEALLLLDARIPHHRDLLGECFQKEALEALESYAVCGYRNGQFALDPGVWGLYLEHLGQSIEP